MSVVCVCLIQVPAYGFSVTTVDSGLLFPLSPNQLTLSFFLLSPSGDSVAGIGVILPYLSTGTLAHSVCVCPRVCVCIYECSFQIQVGNIKGGEYLCKQLPVI